MSAITRFLKGYNKSKQRSLSTIATELLITKPNKSVILIKLQFEGYEIVSAKTIDVLGGSSISYRNDAETLTVYFINDKFGDITYERGL